MHGMEKFNAMKGQIYNVGLSDANLSKLELCQAIKKQIPSFEIFQAEVGEEELPQSRPRPSCHSPEAWTWICARSHGWWQV
jgi:hypothetical protein